MSNHTPSQSTQWELFQNLNQNEKGCFLPKNEAKLPQKLNQKTTLTIRFTDFSLKKLEPKDRRIIYWSSENPNFGIRVSPSGSKTWIFRYRFDNKTRRISLGRYPKISLRKANQLIYEMNEAILHGVDPLEERKQKQDVFNKTPVLEELISTYTDYNKSVGKVSYLAEERCLRKELKTQMQKKITEIDPRALSGIFHTIVVRGSPSTASHLYSYVRRLFNFAADIGLMRYRDNPCHEIKLKIPKRSRQRHLAPSEIYLLWNNLEEIHTTPIIKLAIKFMLLTVTRTIDVRKAKWTDVNLNERVWILPKTKNGRLHRVYLGDLAIDILQRAKQYTDGKELVFCSPRFSIKNNENPELLDRNSLSQALINNFPLLKIHQKFTPHDLRRTGATLIAGLFGRRDFASMALNHTCSDVTGIYDQYTYDREKKMTLNALNKAIGIIVHSANVESVPDFEELRDMVIHPHRPPNSHPRQNTDSLKDLQAILPIPEFDKLFYVHDD
ncbi:tyrosine-type recombinase/integrase [uncultured Croceitalea sp.]|uniref:tyrosine-type recombinase/integrase n=1 Tax=uncultured Croceitalea sp. TaxID=1798908 RepID=UPI00374E64AC